jgi:hypothetical protein
VVACDGDQPLRFSVDPPLPEGLRISRRNGTIHGSPTEPGGDAPSRHTVRTAHGVAARTHASVPRTQGRWRMRGGEDTWRGVLAGSLLRLVGTHDAT